MPEPFTILSGTAAPLAVDDVDTDQVIPAEFLKVTEKKGLGKFLFYRWRYDGAGTLTGDFVLDRPEYKGSKIVLAGRNFGIGSSRENAVWAFLDAGIRCVVASSFGDIFYNNATKNGLLCLQLEESLLVPLRERASTPGLTLTVNLQDQTLSIGSESWHFAIERNFKERLLSGTDDIGLTALSYEGPIRNYELTMPRYFLPKKT